MPDLSAGRRAALAQIIARCPDAALERLAPVLNALAGAQADEVRRLLDQERLGRRRMATAFAALKPLFQARADGVEALSFPAPVLARLWADASARAPELLADLDTGGPEEVAMAADRLCLAAAAAVRARPEKIWPEEIWPPEAGGSREAALAELAGCFDLAPLVRRGLAMLPAWLDRPDEGQAAALRLMRRDADDLGPHGARRLADILFAHVDEAWRILRLVAGGREAITADSEMAVFVRRLVAALQVRAERIVAFRPGAGLDAKALGRDADWCAAVLAELDRNLEMRPGAAAAGPWAPAVRQTRLNLLGRLSELLAQAEPAVERALPLERVRVAGRMTRLAPRLDAAPDAEATAVARDLLGVAGGVRAAAGVLGLEAERARVETALTAALADYADQALERLNGAEEPERAHGLALVGVSADLLEALGAQDAARTVRRRQTAALRPDERIAA